MRAIGIDLGIKTMGLAITDLGRNIVSPLLNFEFTRNNYLMAINKLKEIFHKYRNEISTIVLGYPTKMSGEKTEWTYTVEKFANSLESTFPNVKVILQDERMTTITATSFLKEDLGIKMSKIKKIKDKMSSVVILNEYLESMKKNKN